MRAVQDTGSIDNPEISNDWRKDMGNGSPGKKLIRALKGEAFDVPPMWLMRQAGRYLPEYRAIRAEVGGFLDLCFDPVRAEEVTLQPIRRYGFDAAILFSDILVIPQALGQPLWFVEGEGPKLEPLADGKAVEALQRDGAVTRLSKVMETVSRLSRSLPTETSLIGFAGAPWTVATYMIEGGSSRDFMKTKRLAFEDPGLFDRLIDIVTETTADYLVAQIEAGAEAIQIFDSWAGVLDEQSFRRHSIAPARRIVERIRNQYPAIPIIGFPKGAGALYRAYVEETGVNGVSLDSSVPLDWAREVLGPHVCLQGNLEPLRVLAGSEAMDAEVDRILSAFKGVPFIFNLGHGIHKDTDPEAVASLVERVRAG